MKEIKTNKTEEALSMYKETVSPSKESLLKILNQIPEKEKTVKAKKEAIRSPYMWTVVPEIITLCFMFFISFPTLNEMYTYRDDPFFIIDKEIEHFDLIMNDEDEQDMMIDYNDNLL